MPEVRWVFKVRIRSIYTNIDQTILRRAIWAERMLFLRMRKSSAPPPRGLSAINSSMIAGVTPYWGGWGILLIAVLWASWGAVTLLVKGNVNFPCFYGFDPPNCVHLYDFFKIFCAASHHEIYSPRLYHLSCNNATSLACCNKPASMLILHFHYYQ